MWAVARDGRAWSGAAAVAVALGELDSVWSGVGALYACPPLRWVADRAYGWFARRRRRFARWGVTPACARPGVRCERER